MGRPFPNKVKHKKTSHIPRYAQEPLDTVKIARTVSADGGAEISPATNYQFRNAYFSIVDEDTSELLHFAKNIGNFYSGLAEYKSIEWCILNIEQRPLRIYNDCLVA
ncbi:hypothetical protein LCGC14_3156150, partial [marine sediment metagenome]